MTTRTFSTAILLLPFACSAQRFDWTSFTEVVSNYPNSSSGATTINRDVNGDLIIAGSYAEDFVAGTDTAHPVAPGAGTDVYVAKFHPDGTPVWITGFGGTWYDYPYDVRSDADGNIVASAYIQTGSTVFEDTTITNTSDWSVIKLDPNGGFLWQHFITGNQATGVAVIGRSIYYTTNGNCVGKLDEDGNVVWQVTPTTGLNSAYLSTLIATPQNELVAFSPNGFAAATITYDTLQIDLPTAFHGYYVRLDTNGTPTGSAVFGPVSTAYYDKIPAAADANGNVYFGTTFTGTLTLGSTTLDSHGFNNYGFVTRFSNADQAEWADSIPTENCQVRGITWEPSLQAVFASGAYYNAADLGNGVVLPAVNADGYIATFSAADGAPQAADHWGGPLGSDYGYELTSDGNGIVFGCGWAPAAPSTFRCRTYANRTGGVLFAYSQGSDAIAPVQITSDGTTLTAAPAAASMQWFFNGDTIPGATSNTCPLGAAGTYSVIATNEYGCSSTDQFIFDAIAELANAGFTVYPVPAADMLWIQVLAQQAPCTVDLYSATGSRALSFRCGPGTNAIDIRALPDGVYLLRSPDMPGFVASTVIDHP